MVLLRTVHSHSCRTLLNLRNPFMVTHLIYSNPTQSSFVDSICQRSFSLLSVYTSGEYAALRNFKNIKQKHDKARKPLDVYFKEALGLSEKKFEETDIGIGSENAELKKRLRKLEVELANLMLRRKDEKEDKKGKREEVIIKDRGTLKHEQEPISLSALFGNKMENLGLLKEKKLKPYKEERDLRMDNPEVYKDLSSDMQLFAHHLYKRGYFKGANFLPRNKFDITCFENSYAREFVKFAAEKFGKDNHEIARWLSGSDLKKVALFGCPTLARKTVFSAKRLRTYLSIQEDIVCSKCPLKESCKFVNQSVWKCDVENLDLVDVMRVITRYSMESVPPKLVLTDEVKASVSRLLKDAMNLCKTLS